MAVAERVAAPATLRPAPFGSRLAAYILDWLVAFILSCIFLAIGGLILLVTSDMGAGNPPDRAMYAALIAAAMVAPVWLVITLAGWTFAGRSVGKLALNLRIVTRDGEPPGILRALGRLLVALVETAPLAAVPPSAVVVWLVDDVPSGLRLTWPLGLALLVPLVSVVCALVDREHRALHDLASGTRVISEA